MSQLNNLTYLPHCHAVHASIHHPLTFKLCQENLLSVPRSAVADGTVSYGGSTGVGLNLPRKVYGEFFERNYFFTSVPVHSKKTLSQVEPASYREKLKTLCRKQNSEGFETHEFAFTRVKNLFDDRDFDYFYNSLSLDGLKADAAYLNFSDSCACASHPQKDKALHCSLMEFLERQALLGSWMTKTCRYAINPDLLKDITPYRSLAEKFLENGDFYIFENNLNLPGYTVIMFYFSHNPADAVQYSVGSKSSTSLTEALRGAFEELYQCYTFLYNTEATTSQLENKAGSGYHRIFQQYNTQETRARIPFLQKSWPVKINSLADLKALKMFTYEEILKELSEFSSDIFYYHHYDSSLRLHFTKILSPDYFAHMSLTNPLNFENKYAQKLAIEKSTAYLEKLPFP